MNCKNCLGSGIVTSGFLRELCIVCDGQGKVLERSQTNSEKVKAKLKGKEKRRIGKPN